MPNYLNGKIYSIRSHQTDDFYIGSTTQSLSKRFYEHKRKYNEHLNGSKIYTSSFEIVKYDDVYVELIENYPCNDKKELERREGKYIREMDCVNMVVAGRTRKEYREENKQQIKQYKEQYYQDNKGKIRQKTGRSYECCCGSVVRNGGKYDHFKTLKHNKLVFQQLPVGLI